MTRKEEIVEELNILSKRNDWSHRGDYGDGFIDGAEWADANPIVRPQDFYNSNKAISKLEEMLAIAEEALNKIGNGESGHFAIGFAQKELKKIQELKNEY